MADTKDFFRIDIHPIMLINQSERVSEAEFE